MVVCLNLIALMLPCVVMAGTVLMLGVNTGKIHVFYFALLLLGIQLMKIILIDSN